MVLLTYAYLQPFDNAALQAATLPLFNYETLQPLNYGTLQPFNYGTLQPFNYIHL